MSLRSALLIDVFFVTILTLMRLSLKKYKLFLQKNQLFSTHFESHPNQTIVTTEKIGVRGWNDSVMKILNELQLN